MNYIAEVKKALAKESGCEGHLLDLYTLLVFTKGTDVTLEDVHDAWAIWKNNIMPDHKSLIPFWKLDEDVQELDREYADAIAKVAVEFGL